MRYNSLMRNVKNIVRFALVSFAAVAAMAAAPSLLLARAGGGEGFGGGGGFGGGSGGGAGGSGLIDLIIWLVIIHPVIGIPLLIIAVVIYYYTHTTVAGAVRSSRQTRGLEAMDDNTEADAARLLRQSDPNFNPEHFYQRVSSAFMKIQDAWCSQKLDTVRPFISDGVHERFRLQFLEQQAEGTRDRMSGITVEQVQLVQCTSDNLFDTAAVRIDAAAVDQTISTLDGRVMSGSGESKGFAEYWSFLRRRGARTLDKNGLIEGNCPNCGAPIELNAGAQCQSCHAQLRSGEYDWVLVEITQESEWRAEFNTALPGVSELQTQDHNFTLADLEDIVSVAFWRKVRADRLGKIDPLRKVAANEFCDNYRKLLEPQNGSRAFWGDCAVGGVRTRGVIPGSGDTSMDQALVEIHWSAKRWQIIDNGPARSTQDSTVAHNLLVLGRKCGIKTNTVAAVSSAHCPQCGAPITDDISDTCSFCGAVLNDGSRGWILLNMLPMSGQAAQTLILRLAASNQILPDNAQTVQAAVGQPARPVPPPSPSGLLAWMVAAMAADGAIDDDCRRMLASVALRQNVPESRLMVMINAAGAGTLQTHEPKSTQEAQEWLGTMISDTLSVGECTDHEIAIFNRVGAKYGLERYDVQLLIKRERQLLYNNAVDALRQRRAAAAAGQLTS